MQDLRRQTPAARRWWHHRAADRALAVAGDVDKRLAVEAQRHRSPQIGVVERRLGGIDDQLARDVPRHRLADRLRRLTLQLLHQRQRQDALGIAVELAGGEGEDRGRWIAIIVHSMPSR